MRMRRAPLLAVIVVALLAGQWVTAQRVGAVGTVSLQATFTSVSYGWTKVERWSDSDPNWPAEYYLPDGRMNQTGQRATFFGTGTPAGSSFLMYYAPGWNTGSKTTPVLLVPGAADNVDREYADPDANGAGTCGVSTCPSTGLMQYLSGDGYRVFAVQFANTQGDNYEQAQTISDAIQVIKSDLGVTKVDVVAWSKGATPARMYPAGVKPSWGRAYQGDVRKLILLGGANEGLDYSFAHGDPGNILVYPECGGSLNGPSATINYTCYGVLYQHPELSIYSVSGYDTYRGQRQMLYRWDGTYGIDQSTTDWYTVYNGGQGYYSYGYGIQYAINQGSIISTIRAATVPTAVSTYLLCGGNANMYGFYNENRGPSDGLVFERSCQSTTGFGTVSANTLLTGDNHLQLGWESTAESTIQGWLG